MMRRARILLVGCLLLPALCLPGIVLAAYHHAGESDAPKFLKVYPGKAGTKLDNCALCHCGGTETINGKKTTYGSCQWCHYKYGYDKSGDIMATLNPYGKDYLANGRSEAALKAIESIDSDGDKYTNIVEINAVRYPGDPTDDPSKVVASHRIFTKAQLEAMPQHSQFMIMNTTKSGDYYTVYSGVLMEYLLGKVAISSTATQITAFSPDGYSQRHPLDDSSGNIGKSYAPFVRGTYPVATYFYNSEADKAVNKDYGWVDYSTPGNAGRKNGDTINVTNGLRLLLALRIDGNDLVPGVLGPDNKLTSASEGPFRVVSPQKVVGPPDQPSTNPTKGVIWQYDANADHNAGFATKCTTIIKVEPLPAGTTDINVAEAGWLYIDQSKVVIYGAIEGPQPTAPLNGATGVAYNPTKFTWNQSPGIDKGYILSYKLEYTDTDPSLGQWKSLALSANDVQTSDTRGTKGLGFALFGVCGVMAMVRTRGARKYLAVILLVALSGAALVSCGGGGGSTPVVWTDMSKGSKSVTLKPNTKYWWRVTDFDRNGGSTVSAVNSFTTGE
jgi:hypothetical protein